MINIGILANAEERNKIEPQIINYLEEIKVKYNIDYIKNYKLLFKKFFSRENKYNIIIILGNDELTYMKRTSMDYDKNIAETTSGILVLPLDNEKLEEIILSSNNLVCPNGVYIITNRKTTRLVPYVDIEYFCSANNKITLFLRNGETEEIFQSNKMIKKQLTEDYFVTCAKGYIVNLFSIKKINKVNEEILLKSGNIIPISRKKFQHVLKIYIKIMSGIKI